MVSRRQRLAGLGWAAGAAGGSAPPSGPGGAQPSAAALDQALEHLVHRGEVARSGCSARSAASARPASAARAASSTRSTASSASSTASASASRWRYLGPAAAGAAGQPRPAPAPPPVQRVADRLLVVVDDRVAVRRLVAGQAQRVQRERVDVRRRPLLLEHVAFRYDRPIESGSVGYLGYVRVCAMPTSTRRRFIRPMSDARRFSSGLGSQRRDSRLASRTSTFRHDREAARIRRCARSLEAARGWKASPSQSSTDSLDSASLVDALELVGVDGSGARITAG